MDAKVKAICGMLRSEDPLRRLAAAIVLGELAPRDATVVKALGDALADANQSLTGAILDAFDAIGSPAALPSCCR
jgi:HEAT repeat protein